MKILVLALLVSSLSFTMQDPANMSRKMLEKAFRAQQETIAQQNEIIAKQKTALKIFHDLNYGTQLEKVSAKADLNALQQRLLNQNPLGN